MRMLISGAPPTPISEAADPIIVTTGPHTPTPASARSPTPGIWPMYMRSTMLYSTLTNCASMLGSAILKTSGPIGSLPRSFFRRIKRVPLSLYGCRIPRVRACYLTIFPTRCASGSYPLPRTPRMCRNLRAGWR